jgi:hypothetical protein
MWMTAKRLKREKGDLLGVIYVIILFLTRGTHLTVPHEQLQQPKPSLSTKSDQAGTRIKH